MASDTNGVSEQELRALEVRVEELVRACVHLKIENQRLRSGHDELASERTKLRKRNEMARTRVEAMISRLKALEADS